MKNKLLAASLVLTALSLSSCAGAGKAASGILSSVAEEAVSAAKSEFSEVITDLSAAKETSADETTTMAETTSETAELTETVSSAETTAETTSAEETTTVEETSKNADVTPAPAKEPEIKTDANGNKYAEVVFDKLPATYEEFIALPQANLSNVYDTAAMTVLALSYYPTDPDMSMKMYEFVSGPRTINNTEYNFIKDRFMDYDYVPRSYFNGAVPSNDYKPSEPYTVKVSETPYTYDDDGYAKMYLTSGGADNDRFVMLRKAKDGKWYLWEQFILVSIREPESNNPWA